MISKKNRTTLFIAIPVATALAFAAAPFTFASSPKTNPAAQSAPQPSAVSPTPVIPASGSWSKIVPHYHNASPYLVLTIPGTGSYQPDLSLYKLCDGPNLLYLTNLSGNAYQSGTTTQVQFDSPECK